MAWLASRRWAGCEKTASSSSASGRRALGTAGISGADSRIRTPGRRTAPHAPLAMAPATVSVPPASKDRQRGRTARASRIRPMTMSSVPVRIHLGIRPECVSPGPPPRPGEPATELHTTRLRRCARSLIAPSRALTPRCVPSMVRPRTGRHERGNAAALPAPPPPFAEVSEMLVVPAAPMQATGKPMTHRPTPLSTLCTSRAVITLWRRSGSCPVTRETGGHQAPSHRHETPDLRPRGCGWNAHRAGLRSPSCVRRHGGADSAGQPGDRQRLPV